MKVYNPTPDDVIAKFNGIAYMFKPGKVLDMTEETANWIIERNKCYGLVNITLDKIMKAEELKNFLATKALEGLHAYLQTQHEAIEACVTFDTELKAQNVYGTILKSKPVSQITHKIEQLTRLIKEMEDKYGVSISEQDYAEKSATLLASVEALVDMFDQDSERQKKATTQEAKMNKMIQDMLPEASGQV